MIDVTIEDGKYTIRSYGPGEWEVLRHGEPWPAFELNGPDNLHMALATHIAELTETHAREIATLVNCAPRAGHMGRLVARSVAPGRSLSITPAT